MPLAKNASTTVHLKRRVPGAVLAPTSSVRVCGVVVVDEVMHRLVGLNAAAVRNHVGTVLSGANVSSHVRVRVYQRHFLLACSTKKHVIAGGATLEAFVWILPEPLRRTYPFHFALSLFFLSLRARSCAAGRGGSPTRLLPPPAHPSPRTAPDTENKGMMGGKGGGGGKGGVDRMERGVP